ncbi:MAG: quinone-dependent dihydroorotate dehydrogenase, partial [Trueperaceae bacterium]|nr:quinone-dependent dihydroorotate dehydrogenase [Trueperaceae bacterium]
MYSLIKPWLFKRDPEDVHDLVMKGLAWSSQHPGALRLIDSFCTFRDRRLAVKLFGLTFPNPIGLAAGFDKNARAVNTWGAMGFGFVEIGSVTQHAQEGNPKPRLFRLPEDEAIINRMGFNNLGADSMALRLEQLFKRWGKPPFPLGINLGKSKITPLEAAPDDYLYSLEKLWSYGDYFVINVSSPNTPGLRKLQDRDSLELLLQVVTGFAQKQAQSKAILLKIAPDLSLEQADEILALLEKYDLSGLIATNTTLSREGLTNPLDEAGGLSGKPLKARSLEWLTYLRSQTKTLPIISVGGIASVSDVYERLEAGANLVQLYTSLIYEGPFLLKQLNRGLLERLEQRSAQ